MLIRQPLGYSAYLYLRSELTRQPTRSQLLPIRTDKKIPVFEIVARKIAILLISTQNILSIVSVLIRIILLFYRVTNFSRLFSKVKREDCSLESGTSPSLSRITLESRVAFERIMFWAGEYRVASHELYRIAEYLARDYKTDINVVLWDTVWFILGLD